jgi:hypothetical protein
MQSPFEFSSPFGVNSQTNEIFMTHDPLNVDITKNNSSLPSYESVCNGTIRSFPINNQLTTHRASRNPPPGLEHPSVTEKKMMNTAILQALRKELADTKSQLVNITQIMQKIENIEKILLILERMQ